MLRLIQLVRLGQQENKRRTSLNQEADHLFILCRRRVTHIYQLYHHTKHPLFILEIAFNQARPAFFLAESDLSVTIAGQVNQMQLSVKVIKVDGDSFSWLRADPCQCLAAQQPVDQRRFPDI